MRQVIIEKVLELVPLLRRQAERIEAKAKKAGSIPHSLGDEKDTAAFIDDILTELGSLDQNARHIMGAAIRRSFEPLTNKP